MVPAGLCAFLGPDAAVPFSILESHICKHRIEPAMLVVLKIFERSIKTAQCRGGFFQPAPKAFPVMLKGISKH